MRFQDIVVAQLQFTHGTLEQVIADCAGEVLNGNLPGASTFSVAAIYAHAVYSEDSILNGIVLGQPPIFVRDNLSAATGVPVPPQPMTDDWAKSVQMDLPAFRAYAAKVYANTIDVIGKMSDADADRMIDTPFGNKQPALQFFATLGVAHAWGHMGEIAALKDVRGLKGLPF